jgi:lipopolysaccharide O-acetyltransferase
MLKVSDMHIKSFLKTVYTYLFNWTKIVKFKSFGKGSFLGRRCTINLSTGSIFIGDEVRIGNDSRLSLYEACGHEASIYIGNNCYIGSNFSVLTAEKIELQDHVLVASFVTIAGENHGINPENEFHYMYQPLLAAPVLICSGTWIGEKVVILPGTTIGRKCIIGASSVVTKDIPDYCVAVGNPARVIKRYNFKAHQWEKYS